MQVCFYFIDKSLFLVNMILPLTKHWESTMNNWQVDDTWSDICKDLAECLPESFRPLAVMWAWIWESGEPFLLPIILNNIAAASDTYVCTWSIKSRDFEVSCLSRNAMIKILKDLRLAWAGIIEITWKDDGEIINLYMEPYPP